MLTTGWQQTLFFYILHCLRRGSCTIDEMELEVLFEIGEITPLELSPFLVQHADSVLSLKSNPYTIFNDGKRS